MSQKPSTPTDYRLYAVGDIHGRLDLLNEMLGMIEEDGSPFPEKKKIIIFLGDYIDRGLDSQGVIDRLLSGVPNGFTPVYIRGNHEDMFLEFMKGNLEIAPSWLSLGGAAALASYGINSLSGVGGKGKLETLYKDVKAKIPQTHLSFVKTTIMSATYGHYYFVHAGIRPHVPFDQQKPIDQMTIRGDFLFSEEHFGRIVVHGHTIRSEPEIKRNRIGIDTGAFATGKLTCLILDGTERILIST